VVTVGADIGEAVVVGTLTVVEDIGIADVAVMLVVNKDAGEFCVPSAVMLGMVTGCSSAKTACTDSRSARTGKAVQSEKRGQRFLLIIVSFIYFAKTTKDGSKSIFAQSRQDAKKVRIHGLP
jgi:hypothetical protein